MSNPKKTSVVSGRDETIVDVISDEETEKLQNFSDQLHFDPKNKSVLMSALSALLGPDKSGKSRNGGKSAKTIRKSSAIANTTLFLVDKNENYEWRANVAALDDVFVDPSRPPVKGCNDHYLRWLLRRCIQHIGFRLLTLFLILVDLGLLVADLVVDCPASQNSRLIDGTVLVLSSYFVLEIIARIFAVTASVFFSRKWWFNTVDFIVVVISFVVSLSVTIVIGQIVKEIHNDEALDNLCDTWDDQKHTGNNSWLEWSRILVFLRILRVVRLIRLTRIYTEHHQVKKAMRQLVSQNKRRYQEDGVDLDLTYVTSRIIAMSFPSSGCMAWYRNPIRDVALFLDKKHGEHYRVYNLCSERTYDDSHFHGRVMHWPIDDHNVPSVTEMADFVQEVNNWLAADPNNVVAVHCKGGKGRTGTLICILLVEHGLFEDAVSSLDYFGNRRTDTNVSNKFQGVETASQIRYVTYYEKLKKSGLQYPLDNHVAIKCIQITGLKTVGCGDGSDLHLELCLGRSDSPIFTSDWLSDHMAWLYSFEDDILTIKMDKCPPVERDVRIKFNCSSTHVPKGYENCAFYFWFHTSFLEADATNKVYSLKLTREEIDNPHKERTWDIFTEKFSIKLVAKKVR